MKVTLSALLDYPLRYQVAVVAAVVFVTLIVIKPPGEPVAALFLSPDQRGLLLYQRGDYESAANRFEDSNWKATAWYRAGMYIEASDAYALSQRAESFFNRGNAYLRAFEYRKAIINYELAVEESPQWTEARENLALARYTLDYIERTREQSDTGEEGGIGADEVVYDNDSNRGAQTEITQQSAVEALSAEKWMRSVDTNTADFLRSRFLLEERSAGEREAQSKGANP
ncbi:MAG: tetratricopeptide repeat protein [Pseudomonadota bacterium]